MCRIGGRLGSCHASGGGVVVEIPPFNCLETNPMGDIVRWVV